MSDQTHITRAADSEERQYRIPDELEAVGTHEGRILARYTVRDGYTCGLAYQEGETVPIEVIGPTREFEDGTFYLVEWGEPKHGIHLYLWRLYHLPEGRVRYETLRTGIRPMDFDPAEMHTFNVWGRVLKTKKQRHFDAMLGDAGLSR